MAMEFRQTTEFPNGSCVGRWECIRELGFGGQGTTFLVRDVEAGGISVLKLLKHQMNVQSRKRMRLEVDTLKFMSGKMAAVPNVLDSNVEFADDVEVPLYFVMQHIEGETLDDFVKNRKRLSLRHSLDMLRQVANTVRVGHLEGFGHRDLKPKNIMVSLSADDTELLTVLDYGLTFNSDSDEVITRSDENIWNEFLSVPETNVIGAERRDLRIDLVHLCGLLLFCLTGRYPQLLRDDEDRPPHRRPGMELHDVDSEGDAFLLLNALFTRGFRQRVNDRVQTVDEFLSVLEAIHSCDQAEGTSIDAIAFRESEILRQHDRVTQVEQVKPRCEKLFGRLTAEIGRTYKGLDLGLFKVKNRSENVTGIEPGRTLQLDWLFPSDKVWVLLIPPHQGQKEIAYGLGIHEGEFLVARYLRHSNPGKWQVPQIVARYPIDDEPDFAEVLLDFKQWLRRSMQELRREIVPAIRN
jgi:hypothetical protein